MRASALFSAVLTAAVLFLYGGCSTSPEQSGTGVRGVIDTPTVTRIDEEEIAFSCDNLDVVNYQYTEYRISVELHYAAGPVITYPYVEITDGRGKVYAENSGSIPREHKPGESMRYYLDKRFTVPEKNTLLRISEGRPPSTELKCKLDLN